VILLIFIAVMFCGLRWLSISSGPHAKAHEQVAKVEVDKRAVSSRPQSMNVVERGLFAVLSFTQSHVAARWGGSWGWAIVLVTVGINLLMLPLRIASMRSSLKLQRLQPGIDAIKARYKGVKLTDPRHNDMTVEIAKLQKDNGVNMFGGCIPLLIQMPLLFAFFGMLRKAGALHGAGWLWLHDLSAPDPHHILPILMVVFQLLVQLYTPSPGVDARQQKIMAYLMTIGFGYVSWHYASGLALYALTGSMLSIATQAVMNHSALGREMRSIPAKC
jgi:YidC/Oxa1 family membrane protein insertase